MGEVFRCALGFGVPWLREVVTGLSLRRHVFEPRPLVDTVALAHSFLRFFNSLLLTILQ